jgi:hypothetical protein
VPLDPLSGVDAGRVVVFYAGHPGAFVDLAADLQRVHGLDGPAVLDDHLTDTCDPPRPCGITGLEELSDINRAIGVLITRGHTPAEAHAELRRRAAAGGHGLADTARHVLTSTNAPPPHPH